MCFAHILLAVGPISFPFVTGMSLPRQIVGSTVGNKIVFKLTYV